MELKIEQSDTEFYTQTAGLFHWSGYQSSNNYPDTAGARDNLATAFPTLNSFVPASAYWRWGKVILRPWKTSGTMTGSNTVWVSGKGSDPAAHGKDLMKMPSPSIP
ncbi:MAG: hypothetical protein OXC07_01715 [Kistimonas sp.]|nr:hypothetical protein [Kistimonas sp.]